METFTPTGLYEWIPANGKINQNQLCSRDGFCKICGEEQSMLRRHFEAHLKQEKRIGRMKKIWKHPLKFIPIGGVEDPDQIIEKNGECLICLSESLENPIPPFNLDPSIDPHRERLKNHYKRKHSQNSATLRTNSGTWTTDVIPPDGKVKVEDLYTYDGTCLMEKCKNHPVQTHLRWHFQTVHLNETRLCEHEGCGKQININCYYAHMKTHTGPARCSVCNTPSISVIGVETHISTHHKPDDNATFVLLTPDEIEEFKRIQKERRVSREAGRIGRETIKEPKKTMNKYFERLNDPSDPLHQRSQELKTQFHELLDVPEDAVMSYHSSFVSLWKPELKIPGVVYENMVVTKDKLIYEMTNFFADPNINHDQPVKKFSKKNPRNDFDSFERGHLVSAPNYFEKMHVVPTYLYSNVVPMFPTFNQIVRQELEQHLRFSTNKYKNARVFHFPFPFDGPNPARTSGGVAIPESVGTVAIVDQPDGKYIFGWDIWNNNYVNNYEHCLRNPWYIFQKAGYNFKMDASEFVFISQDAR